MCVTMVKVYSSKDKKEWSVCNEALLKRAPISEFKNNPCVLQ